MYSFKVEGGHQLSGEIHPQGSKNEALQVLSAVLMTSEEVTIDNIPCIEDVNNFIDILSNLNVKVTKNGSNNYSFRADDIDMSYLRSEGYRHKGASLRGSVMILGALLGRYGESCLYSPGGDKIGRRKLDTHIEGFKKLGAVFQYEREKKLYTVHAKKLKGDYILLDEASVTGTANVIMAAVFAQGTTVVYNAACEPYIQQLCKMLNSMGANISGIGSNMITVVGVDKLHGCEHKISPDIIEVGSWIGLAAVTRSEITIKNTGWENLGIIPDVFKKMGISFHRRDDDIYIPQNDSYKIERYIDNSIFTISDAPWPGFTPDLLSIIIVVATQANGNVLVHQKMYESRLFFVDKLIDMGAQIILCDPHRATVMGLNHKYSLVGIEMSSPDIRAGASLLIAALSAKGTSVIHNVSQIDRGYENIDGRLNSLGAKIVRIKHD
ncbi:UDP-N-acetylglucosamine 1-carboxyvinyltransferase [Ichthyobacterium seriolicida]|uniref:UDP-N-acetylglucosamine 1-carboxyvinyltransferase n=1 Tax=Ichthyobacterium seriolicida TaxID=242600 RepID=A0A1J1DZA0_9FLAO|nr:UDP-N-acetylglucosamine 1-carboxyvinyltransferase [Ichthyobacterium seriolicida]BAV95247.1 UDP-N-acetylglucosamine 1-carboxyvinyltransferase [Ichthyobacterium seriolicida]